MKYKSPLHKMSVMFKTEFWNDSCSISELKYAIENGAVGATSNPVIVKTILEKEMDNYKDYLKRLIKDNPYKCEDSITWLFIEKLALDGAQLFESIYKESKGEKGFLSIQTNPKYWNNPDKMCEQACHFSTLANNMHVKIPVTKEGVKAIEIATYKGVNINATVCFTLPQALAVAEAVEIGLKKRESEGLDNSHLHPVCTIMVGRLDDWLKKEVNRVGIVVRPEILEWAGVAVMKKSYKIFKEKKYKTKLLAAAYRNYYHWTEFIGGDLIETMPYSWQKKFNSSSIDIVDNINREVDNSYLKDLLNNFVDFERAYNSMKLQEFNEYGPVKETLKQFLNGYDELIKIIRTIMFS